MLPYVETVSGKRLYFLNPQPDQIDINDIAHALSQQCRYAGHSRRFYSIAEHSGLVSKLLIGTNQELAGLLHDAAEAYLSDIPAPVKQFCTEYQRIEEVLEEAIADKFGFEYPLHPAVKHCDLVMLSTESHNLMPSQGNWEMWERTKRPPVAAGIKPSCVEPKVAKTLFLERFYELAENNCY